MPIPHEVTKEFFVPEDDLPFFGNELFQNNNNTSEQMANAMNDLMHLFNLLDAAFGRNNNQNNQNNTNQSEGNTNSESENINESNDKDTETTNESEEQTENSENEDSMFNTPNFDRVREGILNRWLGNQGNEQHEVQEPNNFENRNSYF